MILKIDVLGTTYKIRRVNAGQDEHMEKENLCGYCDEITKEIVVLNLETLPDFKNEPKQNLKKKENEILRHELIHAFLNESGLRGSSLTSIAWAHNEEMVDWFALQFPKLLSVFEKADCIES